MDNVLVENILTIRKAGIALLPSMDHCKVK
jgi:hypothetical protein